MGDLPDWWNPDSPAMTPKERKKVRAKTKPRGHAAMPGTGPAGLTCKDCKHIHRNQQAKVYLKCGLMQRYWTGGTATDIRAGDAACSRWEKP